MTRTFGIRFGCSLWRTYSGLLTTPQDTLSNNYVPFNLPISPCGFQVLEECWTSRNELYQKHLDYLKWKQDIGNIEVWLDEMEHEVDNDDVGRSLDEVNLLIGKKTTDM